MYLLLVLSLPQAGHHLSLHVSVDCSLPSCRPNEAWQIGQFKLYDLFWWPYCSWHECWGAPTSVLGTVGDCPVPHGRTQVVPVTYHQYDEYPREKKGLSQDLVLDMAAWDLPHLRASSTVLRTMITPRVLENH